MVQIVEIEALEDAVSKSKWLFMVICVFGGNFIEERILLKQIVETIYWLIDSYISYTATNELLCALS